MLLISAVRLGAVARRPRSSGPAPRWCDSARALFGHRAPLVDALVAGWRGELDPDLRKRLRQRRVDAPAGDLRACTSPGSPGGSCCCCGCCGVPRHPARGRRGARRAGIRGVPRMAGGGDARRARCCCWWRSVAGVSARCARRAARPPARCVVLVLDPWAIADAGRWLSVRRSGRRASLATRWSDRAVGARVVDPQPERLGGRADRDRAGGGSGVRPGRAGRHRAQPRRDAAAAACYFPAVFVPRCCCTPSLPWLAARDRGVRQRAARAARAAGARRRTSAPGAACRAQAAGAPRCRGSWCWLAAAWIMHGGPRCAEAVRRCSVDRDRACARWCG